MPPAPASAMTFAGVAAAVRDDPLLAVVVGLDVPDPFAVRGRGVLEHLVRVLEDVPVGVDETQLGVGHHCLLAQRAKSTLFKAPTERGSPATPWSSG